MEIGIILVVWADARYIGPRLIVYFGPRGPSGVKLTLKPSCNALVAPSSAFAPPFLEEPRIALMPKKLIRSETYCPSRDALTTATVRILAFWGNTAGKNSRRLCQVTVTHPAAVSIRLCGSDILRLKKMAHTHLSIKDGKKKNHVGSFCILRKRFLIDFICFFLFCKYFLKHIQRIPDGLRDILLCREISVNGRNFRVFLRPFLYLPAFQV